MKGLCWVAAALVLALVVPSAALAQQPSVREAVSTYEYTQNLHPLGYSPMTAANLPGQG